ncbi:hypothetical protein QOZ80_8BG0650260 [Eleusine coracana subsp. coracana]|nr:hypothetical protein QOZ80_8BG0650260 [Eleusine coracana subsp. coracana]
MEEEDVLEVQCAGCGDTLEVERGLTEFACPGCAMPQALPPQLMPPPPPRPRRALPLGSARGPGLSTPPSARVPCDGCGAVLAVPRGIRRVACPLCGDELDVAGSSARLAAHSIVQVVSQPGAVAVAPTSSRASRLPEVREEPISQAISVGQVQPECARIRNPIQQPDPASDENPFDPADIDRIVARLCPPRKQVSQARSNALENTDATLPQVHQLSDTLHSQAAQNVGIGSIKRNSSKKRGGRGPTKLIEPRKEADKPVLTPNNADTWDIDPPCPKVASTISVLLKQWHPGSTFVQANQQTVCQEQLILHWNHYPPDTRATILDEFLKRYKWALGQEAVCLKLFERKIARQFTSLLCDEKRRARIAKVALDAANASLKQTNLDDEDAGDIAVVEHKDDDPLQWKPFPPEWMQPKWWEMLCEHWASEEVQQVSAQKRKNRYTGGSAQHTAGSRTIAMHRKLMIIENGGKPVSDIEVFNRTHKRDGGKGEFVTERAKEMVERFKSRLEETGDPSVDPHLVWVQAGGRNRGRFYGLNGIIDKARIKAMAKATGYVDKRTRKEMFTQDQVQEMISQAMQQLNETWEKRFQTLEQKMVHGMVSPEAPEHAPSPCPAIPAAEGSASHQDASKSSDDEGTYQSATEDDDDDDEDYVDS